MDVTITGTTVEEDEDEDNSGGTGSSGGGGCSTGFASLALIMLTGFILTRKD